MRINKIIIGLILASVLIVSGCAQSQSKKEISELKNQLEKQANLRCQDKCEQNYDSKCREITCKEHFKIGCIQFDPDEMECSQSSATDKGCTCKCFCGALATFELS